MGVACTLSFLEVRSPPPRKTAVVPTAQRGWCQAARAKPRRLVPFARLLLSSCHPCAPAIYRYRYRATLSNRLLTLYFWIMHSFGACIRFWIMHTKVQYSSARYMEFGVLPGM